MMGKFAYVSFKVGAVLQLIAVIGLVFMFFNANNLDALGVAFLFSLISAIVFVIAGVATKSIFSALSMIAKFFTLFGGFIFLITVFSYDPHALSTNIINSNVDMIPAIVGTTVFESLVALRFIKIFKSKLFVLPLILTIIVLRFSKYIIAPVLTSYGLEAILILLLKNPVKEVAKSNTTTTVSAS